MDESKQRKAPRLRASLSVQVLGAKRTVGLTTVDVSRSGLFLHSVEPTPVRQLLRLRIDPGEGREPIIGHGMVVRVVEPEEAARTGADPGMGLEFYGFGGEPRKRWEEILQRLTSVPGVAAASAGPRVRPRELQPIYCEAAHRLPGHSTVLLLLRVANVEQLYEVAEHHLGSGAVLVQTAVRLQPGSAVELRFTHPLSKDIYDLQGTVRGVLEDEPGPGLEVALTPSRSTRQELFRAFIAAGLPEEELSLEVIED